MTKTTKPLWYLKPTFLFTLISIVNLLNYIDRGIIPGASIEINDFIQKDIDTNKPDIYLGLLQSSFIIGFMAGSVIFSHMIHTHSRFYLTGIGCAIWIAAVMVSGISYYSGSYAFLLFARIFSGFGEASMQCTIPPWIQSTAKPQHRGMWLGIFYTAIPVGTAIGYAYSAVIAVSIGWQFAFWFEGLAMVPFVFFMFAIAKHFPSDNDQTELEKEQRASLMENEYANADSNNAENNNDGGEEVFSVVKNIDEEAAEVDEGWRVAPAVSHTGDEVVLHNPSILEELWGVVKRPVWICITIATAAQAAVLIGISTFGAAFVMGLGFFNTETEASTIFGVIISIAGMIATPFGGVMVDYLLARPADDESTLPPRHLDHPNEPLTDGHGHIVEEDMMNSSDPSHNSLALYRISWFIAISTLIGTFLLCICILIKDKAAFLFVLGLGSGIVLTVNPAMNMAVMLAVPNTYRAFAIAINIVCLHAFGDVPAPVIIGLIKDTLAPNCVAAADADDDNIAASAGCREESDGLRLTMFVSQLWLIWTILGGIMAAWYANKALKQAKERTQSVSIASNHNNNRYLSNEQAVKDRNSGLVVTATTFSALHTPASTCSDSSNTNNNISDLARVTSVTGCEKGLSLTSVTVSPLQQQLLQEQKRLSQQTNSNNVNNEEDEDQHEQLSHRQENVDRFKRLSHGFDDNNTDINKYNNNTNDKKSNKKNIKKNKKDQDKNIANADVDVANL